MANHKARFKDETGNTHGHLKVLRYLRTENKGAIFECQCECGNITEASGGELRSGNRTSCGCGRSFPKKPKAHRCVECGEPDIYARNMCKKCYMHWWYEKRRLEMEEYYS